ncbi:hypothetical protein [Streptomyces californicus]|uniref:hypothetical protein n=1 Tax=Streptomyces californicus TaxID=67351 RepID=UPI0036753096
MDQRSRITGQTAATTSNDMDEALRRVQGRPAPTKPMPSSEFLTDLARRLNQPTMANRTYTPHTLHHTLLMSARLTHQTAQHHRAAAHTWHENKNSGYHTRDTSERNIRDAHDLADYAWDEATTDADRAHALLTDGTTPLTTTALLGRITALLSPQPLAVAA